VKSNSIDNAKRAVKRRIRLTIISEQPVDADKLRVALDRAVDNPKHDVKMKYSRELENRGAFGELVAVAGDARNYSLV